MPTPTVIVVLLVVVAAAIGGVLTLNQRNRRKSALAETILHNASTTAIAAYTVDERGEPIAVGGELFINADTPLVVASTMKIIVLAAYADAVARGDCDPTEPIPITDVETYYLPKTDGGAHPAGLHSLGIQTGAGGFARDRAAHIALDDIARIMIHHSGNAETDYLIARLGVERIAAVMALGGLERHTPLRPILALTLGLFDHTAPLTGVERRRALIGEAANGNFSDLESLMDLYVHDPGWRAAQIAFMQSGAFAAAAGQMGWDGQVEASHLFPKGTAREYARLMAHIASGRFISPAVSALIQQKLESAPTDWPMRLLFHHRYGAKDGVTAGVLTLASYAVPKSGRWAGQTRVVVILTNELPYETWLTQVQAQGIYLLQVDLARASGVFARLGNSQGD